MIYLHDYLQDSDPNRDSSLESYGVCAVALYDYQVSSDADPSRFFRIRIRIRPDR